MYYPHFKKFTLMEYDDVVFKISIKSEWVNVKDRLPNDDQRVLVFKGKRSIKNKIGLMTYYTKDEFGRDNVFVNQDGAHYDLTWITHWMELPRYPN